MDANNHSAKITHSCLDNAKWSCGFFNLAFSTLRPPMFCLQTTRFGERISWSLIRTILKAVTIERCKGCKIPGVPESVFVTVSTVTHPSSPMFLNG